ncbi:FkbM family methyltransferase [Caulobacter sp. CCNWLY153]|jgi:FkbM family methyltransferase|uniref:FkbM family methyltransferase n=1 Tax=Caulobacter radicis TaxID=2172650 RepID=A0A2T9J1Q5_9CAUL|nr:FkbM family methyltransferase [Caulobacter radicis]PVM74016.1 FkbM family methyltransferase [Caulobacter radicis]
MPEEFRLRAEHVDAVLAEGRDPVAHIQTIFGARMEVDLREEVSRSLYVYGSFEDDLVASFSRMLRPGAVFVDIGAHYGFFSLWAATLVGAEGAVISFEPTPDTADRLRRNLAPFETATVNAAAVWDADETLSFNTFDVSWSAFNSYTSIRAPDDMDTPAPVVVQVPALSLDSYFAGAERGPDVIKIDAESAELNVLRGAEAVLAAYRPIVTIEVGDYPHLVEAGVPNSCEILGWIQDRDYVLLEPGLEEDTPHVLRGPLEYGYQNIVCVPAERLASLTT